MPLVSIRILDVRTPELAIGGVRATSAEFIDRFLVVLMACLEVKL